MPSPSLSSRSSKNVLAANCDLDVAKRWKCSVLLNCMHTRRIWCDDTVSFLKDTVTPNLYKPAWIWAKSSECVYAIVNEIKIVQVIFSLFNETCKNTKNKEGEQT